MINYTEEYNKLSLSEALIAQGNKENVLILTQLDAPFQRMDGKRVSYQLNHRWLSVTCNDETDEAWACVQGDENTYWSKRELVESGVLMKNGKPTANMNMFECFIVL